jgi:hypothetical protein
MGIRCPRPTRLSATELSMTPMSRFIRGISVVGAAALCSQGLWAV